MAGTEALFERAARLPPGQRAAFVAWANQELIRREAIRRYPTAGALAMALKPETVQTPDLEMIDRELVAAQTIRPEGEPAARLMISKPSQTGKSERVAVWGTVHALMRHPDWRIIVVTHSEDLALTHSEAVRTIIQTFGTGARDAMTGAPLPDRLGIGIGKKSAASRWQLAGRQGGLVAAGVGTALPGRPADYMLLDDLFAGMLEADSPAHRKRVRTWWDTVGSQRLGPQAPCVAIGTRWNEEDAHAYLLSLEPDRWRVLNFPAIAEPGLHDSLGREPGVQLVNPRGQTDWEKEKATKPLRVWNAMYQGNPTPQDGTLFSIKWFNRWRLDQEPPLYRRIVAIDPAETGKGDQAGIIAAGTDQYGGVVLTDDASGALSAAEWPRKACLLALRTGATEMVFEAYSAPITYERTLKQAYKDLVAEAADPDKEGIVEGVRVPDERPFRIEPWTGDGNALVRSTGLRNAMSTGWCRVVRQKLATFEFMARTWMEGQHSPDRVSAAVVAYNYLSGGGDTGLADGAGSWGQMSDGLR
ncbi:hypothetical protein [Nocardia gipuzkoensis]|uniref:hypothetical protein n=1 Tax=Nocardia gipuzkoensis TaxID=2749991 RepID=UPI00237DFEC9|nr:hypothetical protein [Nocardia gipuzkoensis]MDE1673823.1 hypothetical protein [Nocardia gipuzkoensis]